MTSSETYAARVDAVSAQNARIFGSETSVDPWTGSAARQFRFDPHREPDCNLRIIASYVRSQDIVVDMGGGAGRVCLPLALRCLKVVNVEPSPGMTEEFDSLVQSARITNATLSPVSLSEAEGIQGDISFAADVTYFIRDIATFIRQMEAAATRRVMITVWSEPPPNRRSKLFQLLYGEPQEEYPGHRQLLPVLWGMGRLPDVRVMPESPWWENQTPQTKAEAVRMVLEDRLFRAADPNTARQLVERNFDDLFAPSQAGFLPQWRSDMREMLITWECPD